MNDHPRKPRLGAGRRPKASVAQKWVALLIGTASILLPSESWAFLVSNGWSGQGDCIKLTWSIVPEGKPFMYGDPAEDLVGLLDDAYSVPESDRDFTLEDRPWFYDALKRIIDKWAHGSGLEFEYISELNPDGSDSGEKGQMRIGARVMTGARIGVAQSPPSGLLAMRSNHTWSLKAFRNTFAHEFGHALALQHDRTDHPDYPHHAVMDGSGYPGVGPNFDDIAAVNRLYGDPLECNFETGRLNNDSFENAVDLGVLSEITPTVLGDDAGTLVIPAGVVGFASIDGDSDVDFFAFKVESDSQVTLDLNGIGPSYVSRVMGEVDFSAFSVLTLRLYDENQQLISELVDGELGQAKSLSARLVAGTYFAEVTGLADVVQFYRLSMSQILATCGDGVVDSGEQCDDGDLNSDFATDSRCSTNCTAIAETAAETEVDEDEFDETVQEDAAASGVEAKSLGCSSVSGGIGVLGLLPMLRLRRRHRNLA